MKLMLLIPTLNEPFYIQRLKRLISILQPQIDRFGNSQVDYLINDAGRSMTIGAKRNLMIAGTESKYFGFIDSDDIISENYLDEIMFGISQNPDCVTMCGTMTTDGKDKRNWTIKLGSDYTEINKHYYRWPNHLAIMKRSLVENVKFPDIKNGEDFQWSKQIRDKRLLNSEFHITKQIYHYDFIDPRNRR